MEEAGTTRPAGVGSINSVRMGLFLELDAVITFVMIGDGKTLPGESSIFNSLGHGLFFCFLIVFTRRAVTFTAVAKVDAGG